MHQINARAKRETLVEKKGTTKKTREREKRTEKPTHIKQKRKPKVLSSSIIV